LRKVGEATSPFVERDTVEINVETIVWPSNETGNQWQKYQTDDPEHPWNGFAVPEGWLVEKSLGAIINGQLGAIRTHFPRQTQLGWEGPNVDDPLKWASIPIPKSADGSTEAEYFTIEVTYAFEDGPHSKSHYVDADNGQVKPGYFANSGVYIDHRVEIQIFDTEWLLNAHTGGVPVIIDGQLVNSLWATVSGENVNLAQVQGGAPANSNWKIERVNQLITGIAYGVNPVDPITLQPVPLDDLAALNAAPQGNASMTIKVRRYDVTDTSAKYDLVIQVGGRTYKYVGILQTHSGPSRPPTGLIYLQSHWGSGVAFTAAKVTRDDQPNQ
jgi:hypothetical protein